MVQVRGLRKDVINRAIENGNMNKIAVILSASNILMEIATSWVEEASDLAEDSGFMLGDVKYNHNKFVKAYTAYQLTWKDLINSDKNRKERMDDYLTFFPYFAKALAIAEYVTDPSTGKLVSEGKNEDADDIKKPNFADGVSMIERSLLKLFTGKDETPIRFRKDELTDDQKEMLGNPKRIIFDSYEFVADSIASCSKYFKTLKSEVINEALLQYLGKIDKMKEALK